MGSVWVARHLQLDVDIAIKFMAPQVASSADLRARFEREAKVAAILKSPNAAQVHDYGVEDGSPYIVMELLEGEDLAACLARERRLSLRATLDILEQVGKALRRAHELGLIHRDLKPGNIFLARLGDEQIVKVVDFGIAKSTGLIAGAQATRTGALLGSPSYMSPEQVRRSNHVDHRTDLWSLGVIAFQCLTGRLPFPGDEIGEVLVDVCTAPIPLASEVAPDLGPEIDGFFQRALARDPKQRFQSAAELVEAFASLARNVGVHASRSSGPDIGSGIEIAAPIPMSQPEMGTLSPSAQTRPHTPLPSRGRRTAITIGAAIAAAVLGLGLFAWLRAPSPPDVLAGPQAKAPAEPSPPSAALAAPEAALLLDTTPLVSASPSASAAPPSTSTHSGKAGRRPPPAPSRKTDDLLQHM
ncbi:serine/threonine protein kinase [Polyangium jinanense]|uniref:Serine/threonine protein kinase n=2 Tax=Polyangium jinanense TaxID=2829994 RepID=A0A9X3X2W4_9BACT|nr:serine/threonine protein kinase [Polyangium jinanense]MDC3982637.1 serine/threonine protein kinase [Polyangium jinanense]